MQRQTHRRRPSSFWEDFADYLFDSLKAVLKMLGMVLLALYLLVSMLVGMYHVTIYLFWILWSSL
jgi:hypothetical protein